MAAVALNTTLQAVYSNHIVIPAVLFHNLVLAAYPALIFHLTFETEFVEWLKKVFTDFIRVLVD